MAADLLVNIDVDDLEKAVAFYSSALGLEPARRFGTSAVEMVGSSSKIYLLVKAAHSNPLVSGHAKRSYARHWTPVHIDFVVDDIDAAAARARAAGAKPEGEIARNSWGYLAMFADPFGNGFCLIEFRNRGYDEIAT